MSSIWPPLTAMASAFALLSRGLHFDRNRFKSDAKKFGLVKEDKDESGKAEAATPLPSPPESRDVSSESSESESHEPALLGDIQAEDSSKKRKKKKKKKTKERLLQLHRQKINQFRNAHRIRVTGEDVPEPVDSWERLQGAFGVPENLVSAIRTRYAAPTPIQMQAIPCLLEKRDLLACAPTGSGKTAAYLIPLLHLLREPRKGGVRAIVLAPTRELALQIQREAAALGECRGLRTLALDPTANKASKRFGDSPGVQNKFDLLVSTPNRLVYLINEGKLKLGKLEWLIVDESDKLFEAGVKGFRDQLAVVYKACDDAGRQGGVRRAMFSATLAADVEQWCRLNLDNVLGVTIGERNTATAAVEQKLVYAGTEKGKLLALQQLVQEGIKPPVLIFVQTKDRAKELHKELQNKAKYGADLRVDVIHSDRSELQRDASVRQFRAGRVWVLICTELLGRGIDFKGVNLVVNYDFPNSVFAYIHRIGRTGRAGRGGKAVTFFTDQDKTLLRSVAQVVKGAGGDVPDYMFQLKKATRQDKRRLAKRAVEREAIIPESKYDKGKRIKREQMIEASKRRKRKRMEEQEEGEGKEEEEAEPKKAKKSKDGGSIMAKKAKKKKKKIKAKKAEEEE